MGINPYLLQQYLPFTVLKHVNFRKTSEIKVVWLQQYLPFTVLKPSLPSISDLMRSAKLQHCLPFTVLKRIIIIIILIVPCSKLQQPLPFTVCAEGCETAEEQSDDEVRTSQVPERSEGKIKVMRPQYLLFTVLKLNIICHFNCNHYFCCNSTYRLRY